VTPGNSTDTPEWTSGNPDIATVDPDTGEIIGVAAGETTITVTVGGKSDSITVTVTDPGSGGGELPVNQPGGGFTPDMSLGNINGNGFMAKHDYDYPDDPDENINKLYHFGSIRLSDVVTDGTTAV